jgi:antitoxin (DNA-binding transcriptional repressor) of toxin-antitoxin stability system
MAQFVTAGGNGKNGKVSTLGADDQPIAELIATDTESIIGAGQKGRPARVSLYDTNQKETIRLTAGDGKLSVGGGGVNSRITARGKDGQPVAELIATDTESIIGAGQKGRPARVSLYDTNQKETIRLDAAAGDIVLFNADVAEEFDVDGEVAPGSVVVLNADGMVRSSDVAYDGRVVGVVSGAGGYRPGIVLDRRQTSRNRRPVAMMGKVECLVDATETPIHVGDLLTTSHRRGHAMRAIDRDRALGAVLGKALRSVDEGTAVIPVLVTLR